MRLVRGRHVRAYTASIHQDERDASVGGARASLSSHAESVATGVWDAVVLDGQGQQVARVHWFSGEAEALAAAERVRGNLPRERRQRRTG